MKTQLLRDIIKNSVLSNNDLKKKIMKVLVISHDITKIRNMTQEVLSCDFSSLKPSDVDSLIEELKNNNEQINDNKLDNTSVINMLKNKIALLEKQLAQVQPQIKDADFNNNVYIIKDNELIIIPTNLFNIGSDSK
jgi:hypothetical protein